MNALPATTLAPIVAGVDVGGPKKGMHAVALRDGAYLDRFSSRKPAEIAAWCREMGAGFIGVDAPCRWSATGRARSAERELMAQGIWCFSSPSLAVAKAHPKNQFGWMLNGAELFQNLETAHPLLKQSSGPVSAPVCFETFPQAIACALAGEIVSAKQKRTVRRALLTQGGIDISQLTNIDLVDAALCALVAHHVALGKYKTYGDASSGLIVVPRIG